MQRTDKDPANCWAVKNYKKWYITQKGGISGATAMKAEIYARGPISCGICATNRFDEYTGRGSLIKDRRNLRGSDQLRKSHHFRGWIWNHWGWNRILDWKKLVGNLLVNFAFLVLGEKMASLGLECIKTTLESKMIANGLFRKWMNVNEFLKLLKIFF